MGERNFGFDLLKSRLNRDMQEEGIVVWDCLPLPIAEVPPPRAHNRRRLPRHEAAEAGSGGYTADITRCPLPI